MSCRTVSLMVEPVEAAEVHSGSSSADEVNSEAEMACEEHHVHEEDEEDVENAAAEEQFATFDDKAAVRVAELYVQKLAAADNSRAAISPPKLLHKLGKSTSKTRVGEAPKKKRSATAAGSGEQNTTFAADVRCACRAGTTVWTAERDGCIVVRDATSGKLLEKILPHGWESILTLALVGTSVWCGTADGPILIFDRQSRRLLHEARVHTGGVKCICPAPSAGGRGFVVSGGADWRMNMWQMDGSRVIKTFSGHTGGVRCATVLGLEIWTGSDDGTIRVWEAACGLFSLESEPCRATLSGHGGAVHALLAHSDGMLSCSADGTVRCWRPGGSHECLKEVSLPCGPVYSLVPMGRQVWAAGADGTIVSFDGATLDLAGPARNAHSGFISGLCHMQARTTRGCWSFSTADGRVCRWRTEEVEAQHTAERAGILGAELESLSSHMTTEMQERRQEQLRHADERQRDADALAASETAQRQLIEELASSMDVQERDLREAERLRELLEKREAQLAEAERVHAANEQASAMAMEELAARLALAEARAEAIEREGAERLAAEAARADSLAAAAAQSQQKAERLARACIGAAVRAARWRRAARERDSEQEGALLTHAALTRASNWGDVQASEQGEGAATAAVVDSGQEAAAVAEAAQATYPYPPPTTSLASTVATSLDELMGPDADSSDVPTVAHLPDGVLPLSPDSPGLGVM